MLRPPVLAVLGLLAAAPAAPAALASAPTPGLRADSAERGWIRLTAEGPPGAAVEVRERSAIVARLTLGPDGRAVRRRATRWRCPSAARRFTATVGFATVTAHVRTPGCRTRLALAGIPRRLAAGSVLRPRVLDTWGTGDIRARVCARATGHRPTCRRARLAAGRTRARVAFRPWRRGRWALEVRTRFGRGAVRRFVVRRLAHLRVLAAGDSMIQIVDDFVRQRLAPGGARTRSDDHISTGLSVPFALDWPRRAAATARSYRPRVTVVFLGANDGFPIGAAGCCGRAWVRAYAVRARRMMRAYARGGAGRVYWLTLPTPRGGAFRRIFPAVNAALRRAARGLPTVHVVDTVPAISPGFRFRAGVRQGDGVHLNVRGASIAAGLVVRALRRDGVIR